MANVSGWKNFERDVAEALGGRRQLRTMESFSKEAPDVYFPSKDRKKYVCLRTIAVECKKRKRVNIYKFFVASKLKYSGTGKRLILATKTPATARGKEAWQAMKGKLGKRYGMSHKQREEMRLKDFIAPLVTVELDFFAQMFKDWKRAERKRHEESTRRSKSR